jgi:hypothetical protein
MSLTSTMICKKFIVDLCLLRLIISFSITKKGDVIDYKVIDKPQDGICYLNYHCLRSDITGHSPITLFEFTYSMLARFNNYLLAILTSLT